MQPFFVAAGAFGYFGARDCKPWMISSHFVGSSGLSLVIGLYIIAESFLKESGKADLLFFALNGPMDLFMVAGSFASLSLWRALVRLRRQLRLRRAAMYEQLEESATRLGEPGAGASLSRALRGDLLAGAAERRQVGGSLGDGASDSLLRDLRCPISMEVMRDPVIAPDGHSYERDAIERWLADHRTSPMTGAVLTSRQLVPNHRLRSVIASLGEALPPPA